MGRLARSWCQGKSPSSSSSSSSSGSLGTSSHTIIIIIIIITISFSCRRVKRYQSPKQGTSHQQQDSLQTRSFVVLRGTFVCFDFSKKSFFSILTAQYISLDTCTYTSAPQIKVLPVFLTDNDRALAYSGCCK